MALNVLRLEESMRLADSVREYIANDGKVFSSWTDATKHFAKATGIKRITDHNMRGIAKALSIDSEKIVRRGHSNNPQISALINIKEKFEQRISDLEASSADTISRLVELEVRLKKLENSLGVK